MANKMATTLVNALEGQAKWRETKQEEYPHDLRNGASAQALHGLTKTVKDMPEEDPRLVRLRELDPEGLWITDSGESIGAPYYDTPAYLISRYGFGGEPQDPADFLADLAEAIEEAQHDAETEKVLTERGYLVRRTVMTMLEVDADVPEDEAEELALEAARGGSDRRVNVVDEDDEDWDVERDEDNDRYEAAEELREDWAEQVLDDLIGRTSTKTGKTVEKITELIAIDLLNNPQSRAMIEKRLVVQA